MPKYGSVFVLIALGAALSFGAPAKAIEGSGASQEPAAQAAHRPHIVVRPRRLGPNSKRYCRFWLAQQYRVSGPVIVPQQYCWWE